ncbi:MAG TPA: hypothetical protein VGS58_21505, partial [Candidatus Sulfopaludibacter sp.]|nr:hypothetical protein [Candidatus Sulfopaludibacter sp.]
AFWYPAHGPRRSDPHYRLFNAARKRILAAGVRCWIANEDCTARLELHHQEVEFAAAAGVDLDGLKRLHPEYGLTDEESFLAWVESDGNLRVLCSYHHRSPFAGIHHCPEPNWKLQRMWRADLPRPVQAPAKP